MTGMANLYDKFSERREQKTPNSIHKMVPHGKCAFAKGRGRREEKRDWKKSEANLEIVTVCAIDCTLVMLS